MTPRPDVHFVLFQYLPGSPQNDTLKYCTLVTPSNTLFMNEAKLLGTDVNTDKSSQMYCSILGIKWVKLTFFDSNNIYVDYVNVLC